MTTRAPATGFPFETSLDVAVTSWAGLLAGDDGAAVRLAVFSDRSIQVEGEFGGAVVTIGGSNDGVHYHQLSDTAGEPLTFSQGGLKQIVELPVFLKPWVTGGDGSTNTTVTLAGRRSI